MTIFSLRAYTDKGKRFFQAFLPTGQNDVDGNPTYAAAMVASPSENVIGQVVGAYAAASANFNTPAGTTQYSIGDLIANNATAGSVAPLVIPVSRKVDGTGMVRRARLKTTDSGAAGQTVRVHLYKTQPTVTNGDNGAFASSESVWIGDIDITLDHTFSDPLYKGIGVPNIGSEINFEPASGTQNIFALLEARTAFTPQGAKNWNLTLEVLQN